MTQIELIKQEIERRIKEREKDFNSTLAPDYEGALYELQRLLSFVARISTAQSEIKFKPEE